MTIHDTKRVIDSLKSNESLNILKAYFKSKKEAAIFDLISGIETKTKEQICKEKGEIDVWEGLESIDITVRREEAAQNDKDRRSGREDLYG